MTRQEASAIPGGDLAVVHLVVREVGLEPFRRFIRSYRAFRAGVDHTLVIAAKQLDDEATLEPFLAELKGISFALLHVPDRGLDLGSYLEVARETHFARYCFINSRTELRAHDWLAKLASAHQLTGGGIAGASGSWESLSSDVLEIPFAGLPAPLQRLRQWIGYLKLLPRFPGFPNAHLRTNVFVIARETLLGLKLPHFASKWETWRAESGRNSLSRQIERRGGRLLVVDAAGQTFLPKQWIESRTFWLDDQAGLLASDRQTRMYEEADEMRRAELRALAWRI